MGSSKDVFTCMLCHKQFEELPDPPVCDVCGSPLNKKRVRCLLKQYTLALTIKISDEAALNNMRKGVFWFQSPKYYQSFTGNDAVGDVNECAFENILDVTPEMVSKQEILKPGAIVRDSDGKPYM